MFNPLVILWHIAVTTWGMESILPRDLLTAQTKRVSRKRGSWETWWISTTTRLVAWWVETVNCKISWENSFWAYKMIAFSSWILFIFNLILFLFDKYSWLWSNQHPDAVHIHDICLQFHDFIKIELYVQKFKFRHSIVPTNLVHSSMRSCWEPI